MRMLVNIFFLLNFLIEFLAFITLVTAPNGILAIGLGEQWSMHYGFAVLSIASVSLWIWPYRYNLKIVSVVLRVLLTFHVGLFFSLLIARDQFMGMILHTFLALFCFYLYVLRTKWCDHEV